MSDKFDLVIIGGGPGGYVAAIRASQLGMTVAVVERDNLGGICLNWGCIPTKTLLRSSEIYHLLKNVEDFGFSVENIQINLSKIVDRSRSVAKRLADGVKHLMKKNKIQVFYGLGYIKDSNTVSIKNANGSEIIKTKHIIIATGARARELPNIDIDSDYIVTYRDAMVPKEIPKSLVIIGSGAIGIEFASFYSSMGSEVTVIEMQSNILPSEDEEISKIARDIFTKQGINIITSATLESLKKEHNQVIAKIKTLENNSKDYKFDKAILAVGITGNIENIGLEDNNITVSKGHIVVDEYMRTSNPNIYAIGDVTGAPWLAHKASHEGVICVEKIAGQEVKPIDRYKIPGCTYCRPQIASIGYTEKQALEKGHSIRVGKFPYIANGKAISIGETEGLIKTIFDELTGELLGAHMIGADVTELIQGYVIAKNLETTEQDLMHTIFPHPTLSEMMAESVLNAYGKGLHY